MRRARLILEDGTIYQGMGFGAIKETGGEIVFNTSMTGYQEILTDPSYRGEIVAMTYPLMGNYGINYDDLESSSVHVNGFIVKEFCTNPENWRSRLLLEEFLKENNITGIAGIDTRALTKKLRMKGTMRGIISTTENTEKELVIKARKTPELSGRDLVAEVTTNKSYYVGEKSQQIIVLIDCGAKMEIIRSLKRRNCQIIVVPASASAKEILSYQPDGIVVSNGPGDPKDVPYLVKTIKRILGKKPIFGICLGHQLIGLACGADTYKLKFGHRGANHPVKDLQTGKVYITAQNHGFAIEKDSVQDLEIEITHINLHDNSVEGLRHKKYPVFSVQYHPEASPGPRDSHYLFDSFIQVVSRERGF